MKIGIGLPAAVPGVDATTIAAWAADAECLGFASVGVIDRLVYDNLDPLVTLAAAAASTSRIELITTVLNAGWRANPVLLAKQIASVDLISGGRLTVGVGLGGWPEDYAASGVGMTGRGARLDDDLATMRRVWAGEVAGQGGPTRQLPAGRPTLLFGGLVPAAHVRAAACGEGWVAPFLGHDVLLHGVDAVRQAWAQQRRPGTPRIATGRYVSLGDHATTTARDVPPALLRRRRCRRRPRRHGHQRRRAPRPARPPARCRRHRRGAPSLHGRPRDGADARRGAEPQPVARLTATSPARVDASARSISR